MYVPTSATFLVARCVGREGAIEKLPEVQSWGGEREGGGSAAAQRSFVVLAVFCGKFIWVGLEIFVSGYNLNWSQ